MDNFIPQIINRACTSTQYIRRVSTNNNISAAAISGPGPWPAATIQPDQQRHSDTRLFNYTLRVCALAEVFAHARTSARQTMRKLSPACHVCVCLPTAPFYSIRFVCPPSPPSCAALLWRNNKWMRGEKSQIIIAGISI